MLSQYLYFKTVDVLSEIFKNENKYFITIYSLGFFLVCEGYILFSFFLGGGGITACFFAGSFLRKRFLLNI